MLVVAGCAQSAEKQYVRKAVRLMDKKGLFAEGANTVVDRLVFKKKDARPDDDASFCTVKGDLLSAPESYMDVKGPLTADYQNYLETKWVSDLRDRNEVHVFNNVLDMIHE